MKARSTISRWLGWLATVGAAAVIVLAVLVGIARLLLPMAPEYQDDIRRFANEATGFDVQFGRLSASWPLHGPEIRFFDVQIRTRDGLRPVLEAAELSVGVNLLQLITERRLLPGRVAVRRADVRIERLADGTVLVNAVPLDQLLRQPRRPQLPRLDLELQDIGVLLRDAGRLVPDVSLMTRQLELSLAPDSVDFEGEIDGRDELGRSFEFAGTLPAALLPGAVKAEDAPAPEWSFSLVAGDIELGRLLRLLANQWTPLRSGRGQLEVELAMSGLVPREMNLDLELGETQIESAPDAEGIRYRQLGLSARWKRSAGGWRASIDRLVTQRGDTVRKAANAEVSYVLQNSGVGQYEARAEALRLADIWPLLRAVAASGLRKGPLPERLLGELRDFRLAAEAVPGKPVSWQAQATLKDIGLVMPAPGWALAGVSGKLRANEQGGQIEVDAEEGLLRLPWLFRADLRPTRTEGIFAWKSVPAGMQLYTDDLRISNAEIQTRTRLSVTLPRSGSPFIDVKARVVASSAPAVVNHLPLVLFGKPLVKWLDESIITGRVPKGELTWRGPLRAFPYDEGDGEFRVEFSVEDGVLDYAPGWPRLEDVSTTVVIDHNSLSSVENSGTIAGVPFRDAQVRVADLMHKPELQLGTADDMQVGQLLAFLRASPIAQTLGPTLNNVSGRGNVATAVQLSMPIARPRDFRVTGSFETSGASLGLRGVAYRLTDLKGLIRLDNTRLSAEKLSGQFLDEPVAISLRPAGKDEPDLSHVAGLRGATPVDKLAAAFSLPYAGRLDGAVSWAATARVPKDKDQQPFRIEIESDLAGLVSTLGAPLQKAAATPEPLQLSVLFPERDQVDVSGRIKRGISWALRFGSAPGTPWQLERGALRSGGPLASLPGVPGIEIAGSFQGLRFEDWFPASDGGTTAANAPGGNGAIRQIFIDVESFSIFGQLFRDVSIKAAHAGRRWAIGVRGRNTEGSITVPDVLSADTPLRLDMQRLWLQETDPASGEGRADPRELPPVQADIADFSLGDMKFGHLKAEFSQRGDGVVAEPLSMQSENFSISGDGTWVVVDGDVDQQRSELRLQLDSGDIKSTLVAFGYDPVIEGKKANVTLDLFWPGGPSGNFLNIAGGRVVIALQNGQVLPVDPGSGGRLLGLLSVATLPRRLGLDFSDVTDEGLAFDEVNGEFRFDNGTAFTCNLTLDGPVTDIGIVGAVSFPDRSYNQVAVVRPHVTDVLALGAVAGGPVIGGAVVLVSQIFRQSLSSFGESYYRVTGNWDKPEVLKVQRDQVDLTPFGDCERYYAEMLRQMPPEGELGR
ncbi:MAG: hypothetical protein QG595_156 [Pseudomonadota bacterium]|nr:hypothetical protein [Pseudomonadota bacterium]